MSNYYKRNLPHYQPAGGEFFVTFRLANSLPKSVISALKHEHQQMSKQENTDECISEYDRKKYFAKFDSFLDRSKIGESWLKKDG